MFGYFAGIPRQVRFKYYVLRSGSNQRKQDLNQAILCADLLVPAIMPHEC